jgi:hypothetical protein
VWREGVILALLAQISPLGEMVGAYKCFPTKMPILINNWDIILTDDQ